MSLSQPLDAFSLCETFWRVESIIYSLYIGTCYVPLCCRRQLENTHIYPRAVCFQTLSRYMIHLICLVLTLNISFEPDETSWQWYQIQYIYYIISEIYLQATKLDYDIYSTRTSNPEFEVYPSIWPKLIKTNTFK